LAWVLVATAVLTVVDVTRKAIQRVVSPGIVARAIEREQSLRAGALRTALEVADKGPLGRRAASQVAERLARGGRVLTPTAHRRATMRGVRAAVAAVVAILALGAAQASAPDGWRAISHPRAAWRGTLAGPLELTDVPRVVMRGEKLKVRVRAPLRRHVDLRVRATGKAWEVQRLPVEKGDANTVLGPVDADLTLVAGDGRALSDTATVHVTDRPYVGDVAVRAIYPAYLSRAPEVIPPGEPARLPRGTTLTVTGRASTTLSSVGLANKRDTVELAVDGHHFGGRFTPAVSGSWTWFALGEQGVVSDVPQALELEIVPDSAPHIDIIEPSKDTAVLSEARVVLRAVATDDHGIASIALRTWRRVSTGASMPETEQSLASVSPPTLRWVGVDTIDLAPRGLTPGDELHVAMVATDDSPWRQRAVSREVVLRVPSLSEQRTIARAMGDSAAARASAAAKSERQLAQRTSEAARSRADRGDASGKSSSSGTNSTKPTMSYQTAEEAKGLARAQEQLQEQVKSLQRDAQALERQLKAAGAMDSSLQSQLRDAQQLLSEALTPELRKQLDDVMSATKQLSGEDLRRAMEHLAEQQQRLREQLERTAEMLKRAALEGSMQTMRDEARDLAQRERSLSDSLAGARQQPASPPQGGTEQRGAEDLSRRSRDLAQDIEQLAKRLEQERAEAGPPKLQAGAQHARQSADAMQRAAQPGSANGRQGQTPSDRQAVAASEGASQMEQAAERLSDAREQQIQEWKNELTNELDKSIEETLQLSRTQQQLADRARAGESDALRPDQAAVQQGVEKVGERLQKAAQKSTHVSPQSQAALGEARQRVEQATREASANQRPGGETASSMDDAAEALNKAAAQMTRDRQHAAGAQSASGFSELLQQMRDAAKQQGSLNAQAAGLMPAPGMQPSATVAAQARALGKEQRNLAQKLDDAGEGEARAEALAREMRQIADALDQGRVDQDVLDRQQQLFHRLLDAGLTMERDEREDSGKREAQSAIDPAILLPGTTAASGRAADRYPEPTWTELRGLSIEERRAVLEYFKRLNADRP